MEKATRKQHAAHAPDAATEGLLRLMFEMGRKLKSALARDFAPFGMLHFETLRFVKEADAPAMGEVAEYLKIAAPTATDIIDGLAKAGYLKRAYDAKDRRKVRLALSPKGTRLLTESLKKRSAAFAGVIAPLSALDRRELARILAIITND